MRRAAIVISVCCLAGCGGGESEQASRQGPPMPKGDFGPLVPGHGERARPVAPPRKKAPAAVAAELAGGVVGVIGVDGAIGVRPSSLSVSSDGTIEDLEWSGWGSSDAVGDGQLRVLDCDPTCAGGGIDRVRVRIKLSAPRLCGDATYFDRAALTGGGANPPASYVRAPC
jgi:hypothetical protein